MYLCKRMLLFQTNGIAIFLHFFAFSLFIEGATEKVLQFIMPLKSIYIKNLGFIEKKIFFNTTERFKQKIN